MQYACGAWIANTTLPPSQPIIARSFSAVEVHNNEVSVQILNSAEYASARSGRLFRDCNDQATIDSLGASVLESTWPLFDTLNSLDDVMYACACV